MYFETLEKILQNEVKSISNLINSISESKKVIKTRLTLVSNVHFPSNQNFKPFKPIAKQTEPL